MGILFLRDFCVLMLIEHKEKVVQWTDVHGERLGTWGDVQKDTNDIAERLLSSHGNDRYGKTRYDGCLASLTLSRRTSRCLMAVVLMGVVEPQ